MNEDELARGIFALYLPLARSFLGSLSDCSGLSIGQFRVLALIEFDSVRHVTKLAERNLVSQPAMSKTIDTLVRLGYVKRTERSDDRRLSELHVTAKGRASMSAIYNHAANLLSPRLKKLPDPQKKRLALALGDMKRVLDENA